MTKTTLKITVIIMTLWFSSCHDDLDQVPIDPDSFTEIQVYATPEEAKKALAKVYGSLVLTGQQGPAGQPDIAGIDEGFSQFSRMLFNLNEITTDHAVVGWGDPGLPNLYQLTWSADNDFTSAMYYRLSQVVSFSNSFISNAAGLSGDAEIAYFTAEARFIRAYAYYNLMDLFANVPLVTQISAELPVPSNRQEIFSFIESELLEIQSQLKSSGTNEYGRVDEVAAWSLLSRLYLNAEVYTGQARYADVIEYATKAINSTYSIHNVDANNNGTAYDDLFLADNDRNGAQNEFIFTLNFDGINTQTYGGTTFLVHAAIGGDMVASEFGVNGGWSGNRTTKAFVQKFDYAIEENNSDGFPVAWTDSRAMFFTDGQNYEIETVANTFTDGYAISKFKNIDSNGNIGSDTSGEFIDTDLPIIRLAEIYLNYAEAVAKGGGGDVSQAVTYINELRNRAGAPTIGTADLNAQFVLDERSRELYWEGFRRTDLVRYNQFTSSSYLWPFKGNVPNGAGVQDFKNLFPLPNDALFNNPNLVQNPGY